MRLLSGLRELDNVRGHELVRAAGPLRRREPDRSRRLAARAAHRPQPAGRRRRGAGRLDPVSPKGGDIIAPDDVAFDPSGNLYATEVMDGRVSMREPSGRT